MGWGGGKIQEKIGNVEKVVYFERWESYFHKEYAVKHTNILHVFISDAKNGEIKARPDSEEFPIRGRLFREVTTSC